MKKMLCVGLVVLFASCSTLNQFNKEEIAYNVGIAVTVAYMKGKDKLPVEQRDIVEKTWKVFQKTMGTINKDDDFKTKLDENIDKQIKNKQLNVYVHGLADRYWERLKVRIKINKLKRLHLYYVLESFKRGIETGLKMF